MELGLQNKVALVTGGSEGIGLATARLLAREGAKVIICARRAEVLESAAKTLRHETGGTIEAHVADVRRESEVQALLHSIASQHGQLDVLVNNAGTAAARRFEHISETAWMDDFEVKVFGAIRTVRFALPLLRKSSSASVINLLSIGAKQPGANSMPSTVSRGAGLALTKALSHELAAERIRVNAVLIGLVKSGQHDRGWSGQGDQDSYYAALAEKRKVPLGRAGESEEAAALITFLASERAAYITGTAINCDGGLCAVP